MHINAKGLKPDLDSATTLKKLLTKQSFQMIYAMLYSMSKTTHQFDHGLPRNIKMISFTQRRDSLLPTISFLLTY